MGGISTYSTIAWWCIYEHFGGHGFHVHAKRCWETDIRTQTHTYTSTHTNRHAFHTQRLRFRPCNHIQIHTNKLIYASTHSLTLVHTLTYTQTHTHARLLKQTTHTHSTLSSCTHTQTNKHAVESFILSVFTFLCFPSPLFPRVSHVFAFYFLSHAGFFSHSSIFCICLVPLMF